jgi:signal transduction histidine kinase
MLKIKFALLFIVLFSTVFYVNVLNKNSSIQKELDEAIKELKINFEITMYHNTKDAESIINSLRHNNKLMDLLTKALDADQQTRNTLRKQIQKMLSRKYEGMRMRGVLQFHFVFPDNTTFLRMHKPGKYGDNLGDIRYTFYITNKTHKPSSGFEQGKTSHAFRNVFPLFNKNGRYIGCCDIGFTSEYMQKNLIEINKIHSHFLVNKNIFSVKSWKREFMILKYMQSIEHPNFMYAITNDTEQSKLEYSKQNLINPHKKFIIKSMNNSKEFAIYQEANNHIKIIAFLPIKNVNNSKTVAYLVSYTKSKHIQNILNIYHLINYTSFFTLLIIFSLLYKLVSIKESLQKEVNRQTNEILKKDKIVQEQSKLAAMGEMVGSIAHQWRQPLNSLNINIENLDDDYADGLIDEKFIDNFIQKQTQTIHFMSQTIDDFRNFFRVDKIKKVFSIKNAIQSIISMQNAQFKNYNIEVTLSGQDFEIETIESEFKQTILNIISNAKDAIINNKIMYGKIDITLEKRSIYIEDNAGGIPDEILYRIFEPYFTTKEQGKGTGMGLYMSKMIIENNLNATLNVENTSNGARFIITFL